MEEIYRAEESILRHLEALMEQEEELRREYPDFELGTALDDPMFLKLTAPCVGLGLKEAYCALHWNEIAAAAVRKSIELLGRSIRSGGERPRELSDMRAGAGLAADHAAMSRSEREALKKRIYEAKAAGQKVYPAAGGR